MSYLQKLKDSRAFTLIELLVVIAIIGILSSVVLASLNGARESARDSRRQQDLQQIRTALSLYANNNGGDYPEGLYSGTTQLEGNDAMNVVPRDPSTDNGYGYNRGGSSDQYDVCLAASMEGSVPENSAGASSGDACSTNTPAPGSSNGGDGTYYLVI